MDIQLIRSSFIPHEEPHTMLTDVRAVPIPTAQVGSCSDDYPLRRFEGQFTLPHKAAW